MLLGAGWSLDHDTISSILIGATGGLLVVAGLTAIERGSERRFEQWAAGAATAFAGEEIVHTGSPTGRRGRVALP